MREMLAMAVLAVFLVTCVFAIKAAEKQSAIDFCTWSVSSGLEQKLGALTQAQRDDIRGVCGVWYKEYTTGGTYKPAIVQ